MASTDARPVPRKGVAYRVTAPILDADGDVVTGAASLDSEVSKDGGTFADCTNEATEIATGSGMYFLDLTATEMDADTVAIIIKTATAGAKTTPIVLYPEEAGDYRADVTHWLGTAPNALIAGRVDANVQAMAAAVIAAATFAAGAIDAAALAADAIGASEFANAAALKVLTQQMTEAYAADGVAPTAAQALFLIQQMLTEFAIVTTTLTAKKLDGTTTAATFTLDSATDPTSLTRAT